MSGFEKVPIGKDYWKEQEAFIKNSLNNLKNMINNDPGITKQPRLENGAAVFRYKYMGWDWEIVTRKESNGKYSIRIKRWVRLPNGKEGWKTQKNGNNDTFNFYAKDKNTFNRYLGAALDRTIGKNRDKLPTTGGFVYKLLNIGNIVSAEPQKTVETGQEKANTKEQQKVTTSQTPNRNTSQPSNKPSSSRETKETNGRTNLRKKPIDLHYKEKNKERRLEKPNYPENEKTVEGRITRCLRFASITDAVEDRYGIPRGLIMALMAQEGWGDPTVINQRINYKYVGKNKGNLIRESYKDKKGKVRYRYKNVGKGKGDYGIDENKSCDGGAGLIHIQAANAAAYGLHTLSRSTNGMVDYPHGEKLEKAKKDTGNNLAELSELDDRFNPILSVDVTARYLMEYCGGKNKTTGDGWIDAICKYAGRGMQDYGYPVLVFWTTINKIRGNKMPTFKDKEINKVINGKVSAYINKTWERTDLCISRTKNAFNNLNFKIDGQKVSSQEYYRYLQGQWDNYGLSDYVKYNKEHPYKK